MSVITWKAAFLSCLVVATANSSAAPARIADWSQWRYGRVNTTELPHSLVPAFDIQSVERPGALNTVNAEGANFRRIVDLSNLDNSVWTNAPGQSGQPGSPFYENMRENLANGQYFQMAFTRPAVEAIARYRLTLNPGR